MNESQFSNTSQLFHNEYYLNTSFIDNLKHQSLKVFMGLWRYKG